ncbi:flagellar biosynthesis protein FlhA [Sphingorhabdus arenilitoris]|uniref:Flagellar biosynthesis protein FlhA n=1 Tax=Sphingorhabdus arenilitoris TaxID=1490041 RepID=A0ABV8RCG0_9SPHN
MFKKIIQNNNDLFLVIGMVTILLVLFAPIPTTILDFLIILNFSFGMTVLMLTFYVNRPVEFSTFPSLLLVATLFRLSLNVAATRLILTDGYAGEVIDSIGSFAIQGNYVIGLVIFFILVIVQYVVVTAGAQRVSEVAARFTLDSVPGQQMSIDADLNMGMITQEEAKQRRKMLEKEASFYGAMDGASKFVKGDAIAGIIIVLINIIAGWVIGIAQRGLSWDAALQQYTLLTIGDGIVTQVPALIISVATGIIVTRSASDRQLSTEVLSQLGSVPKIPLIVMATLFCLLLLPGMPKWPIVILILIFAATWFAARTTAALKKASEFDDISADQDVAAEGDKKGPPVVSISLGEDLGEAWVSMKPVISDRIMALRNDLSRDLGLNLPSVVIEDGYGLGALEYRISLFGATYGQSEIKPHLTLAIRSETSKDGLPGIEARDPAFGLPAIWVDDEHKDLARSLDYTLVDPITVLMTHFTEIMKAEAALLLTRNEVVSLLDAVRNRQVGLIEELIPNIMSVSDIQRVLQNLVSENVSIRNIDYICEALVDLGRTTKDVHELTELVRQRIGHIICNSLRSSSGELAVLSLDPRAEALISEAVARSHDTGPLIIDPNVAEAIMRKALPMVEAMVQQGINPVLLCGPTIRRQLRAFLKRTAPRLSVISVNEVPQSIDLRSFDVIKTG